MGFFKQYVQSGNFPVFGFKLLIVYSLKIAYLLAVLFLHVSHFRIILCRMITEEGINEFGYLVYPFGYIC